MSNANLNPNDATARDQADAVTNEGELSNDEIDTVAGGLGQVLGNNDFRARNVDDNNSDFRARNIDDNSGDFRARNNDDNNSDFRARKTDDNSDFRA